MNDLHENATWVYNHDRGGNITSNVKYAYTTGTLGTAQETIPYGYGDSNWKDKLTSYNGQTITYDAIGNPTNGGTWTYEWQADHQLKHMSKPGTTVQFKYAHNGLRAGKVVNGTETKYQLYGKLIMHNGFMRGGISAGATFTTVAAKGAKIQQIGKLKPANKSGKGYQGVQYKNQKGSLKSFELRSPNKSGPHQQWYWQQNTWNPKTGGTTGRSIH